MQFIVCCATFVLSFGLLLFNAELFFSQAMSLSTPCEKFQFLAIMSKVKIFKPRVLAYVWVSVWVCGGPSVRVYVFVPPSPNRSHAAQRDSHWSPHAMIRSLRSHMASCSGCWDVHFRNGRILRFGDGRADGDVRRPGRNAIRGLARDERS